MKSILILTNDYPYLPGEQFFEAEAECWSKNSDFHNVYILPSRVNGHPRNFPQNLRIISQFTEQKSSNKILLRLLKGLLYIQFWVELKNILLSTDELKKKVILIKKLLSTFNEVIEKRDVIRNVLRTHPDIKLIYSYWSHHTFYGAVFAKQKFPNVQLITRTHGYDLYAERAPYEYVPLKRYCFSQADKIFSLSEVAKGYITETYNVSDEKIELARLGVDLLTPIINNCQCKNETHDRVHILSIGRCEPVKRFDIAAMAVAIFASQNPTLQVVWHHIGGGKLLDSIRTETRRLAQEFPNFAATFYGELAHDEIFKIISRNFFHCGLNTSRSEGVPVALMEMMSAGIPCIAPDVGGISSLILESNGILMKSEPTANEYAKAIERLTLNMELSGYRTAARKHIENHFNAEANYNDFISVLNQLTE